MKKHAGDKTVCVESANRQRFARLPLSHDTVVLHDVRNMLCVLRERAVACGDQLSSAAERAVAIESMQLIVEGLAEVVTAKPGEVGQTDLTRLISEAQPMLHGLLSPVVQLSIKVPDRPVVVRGTSVALKRLLLELCANARSATPGEGQLLIELRVSEAMEQVDLWPSSIRAGHYALVIVRDTGSGMTPEMLNLAFKPGHTTKFSSSSERGHGLAVVQSVLEGLGGGIHVSSLSDEGAILEAYIPLQQEHEACETKPSVLDS
ncbi:MAG: two-component system cell cycle sensor histidine kinase/response regulator CckA [Planctomycetota bacterium]|jgi:two-component system cell cycle sensor histidine kinase/response regulator CckA